MVFAYFDRVKETSTTTGTGALSLGGAVSGFRAFSSVYSNADTFYYSITDLSGPNWEVGLGTYTSSGNKLTRTTVLSSSNAGSLVNFTSGSLLAWVDLPAAALSNLPNGTTATTQSTNDNSTKLATDAFVLANGAAVSQQSSASGNITNNSNYPTFLMAGAKFSYTPVRTGKILVMSQFYAAGSNTPVYSTAYGTGTAPNAGAAATGTLFGPVGSQGNAAQQVTLIAYVALSVGTTYWFDLQTTNIPSGTVTINNLAAIIVEL